MAQPLLHENPPQILLLADADFLEVPDLWHRTVKFYQCCLSFEDRIFSNFEKNENLRMALMGETPEQWAARMGASADLLAHIAVLIGILDPK